MDSAPAVTVCIQCVCIWGYRLQTDLILLPGHGDEDDDKDDKGDDYERDDRDDGE